MFEIPENWNEMTDEEKDEFVIAVLKEMNDPTEPDALD